LARDATRETIVIPFNDIENSARIIREHKNELAALIMEPVMFNAGCVTPRDDYLKAVRELTQELGIVLIFDEVITGFHLAPGGAQEYYGVTPDITTFGKAIANGFPLAAVVGKREFMNVTDPKSGTVTFSGTYNANQMSIAACSATLKQLKTGRVQKHLHESAKWLMREFDTAAADLKIDAILRAIGGKFQVYFTRHEPKDYRTAVSVDREKYRVFQREVVDSGVIMHPSITMHHAITYAHSRSDLRSIIEAMEKGLKKAEGL
jgi:glutamate-1-semialdehyde 2,1-aminomutase